jgi:hypothetical protein
LKENRETESIQEMKQFPHLYSVVVCPNNQSMESHNCAYEATFLDSDDRMGVALLQVDTIWQMNTENISYGKTFRVKYEGVTQQQFPFADFVSAFGVPPGVGNNVYVLGYPRYWGGSQQVTSSSVLSVSDSLGSLESSLTDGISGAPVYDDSDAFVGMVFSSSEGTFIPSSQLNMFLMDTFLPDIPSAGSLEVSCEEKKTRKKENGLCVCDYGYEWDNTRGECSPRPISEYCGPNAYRVEDYCECFEGFSWGSPAGSSSVQCLLLSEMSDDQLEESTGGLPTYSWRDLIFTPIYEIKVFAKKLRNEKALFLWKPVDGEKANDCYFDIWDEDENKQTVIFQRKNVALVKLSPEAKHRVEISGCTVDSTEKTAWSSFYISK